MGDTTVKKVDSRYSPRAAGACMRYLAAGKRVSMRIWENEQPSVEKKETCRKYETVGFVLKGKAELYVEGQKLILQEGDSWVIPMNARHRYRILEEFSAIEATSPPAEFHGRDLPLLEDENEKFEYSEHPIADMVSTLLEVPEKY